LLGQGSSCDSRQEPLQRLQLGIITQPELWIEKSSEKEGIRDATDLEIRLKVFTICENFIPTYFLRAHLLTDE